jgi:hypothetical protein
VRLSLSRQRISAGNALNHPWLTTEMPRPTPIELMPRIRPPGQDDDEDDDDDNGGDGNDHNDSRRDGAE